MEMFNLGPYVSVMENPIFYHFPKECGDETVASMKKLLKVLFRKLEIAYIECCSGNGINLLNLRKKKDQQQCFIKMLEDIIGKKLKI